MGGTHQQEQPPGVWRAQNPPEEAPAWPSSRASRASRAALERTAASGRGCSGCCEAHANGAMIFCRINGHDLPGHEWLGEGAGAPGAHGSRERQPWAGRVRRALAAPDKCPRGLLFAGRALRGALLWGAGRSAGSPLWQQPAPFPHSPARDRLAALRTGLALTLFEPRCPRVRNGGAVSGGTVSAWPSPTQDGCWPLGPPLTSHSQARPHAPHPPPSGSRNGGVPALAPTGSPRMAPPASQWLLDELQSPRSPSKAGPQGSHLSVGRWWLSQPSLLSTLPPVLTNQVQTFPSCLLRCPRLASLCKCSQAGARRGSHPHLNLLIACVSSKEGQVREESNPRGVGGGGEIGTAWPRVFVMNERVCVCGGGASMTGTFRVVEEKSMCKGPKVCPQHLPQASGRSGLPQASSRSGLPQASGPRPPRLEPQKLPPCWPFAHPPPMVSSTRGSVQLGQGSQVPLPLSAPRLSRSLSVVLGEQWAAIREGSRLRTDVARSVGFGARTSALIPT